MLAKIISDKKEQTSWKKLSLTEKLRAAEEFTRAAEGFPRYYDDDHNKTSQSERNFWILLKDIKTGKIELNTAEQEIYDRISAETPSYIEKQNAALLREFQDFVRVYGYKPRVLYKQNITTEEEAESALAKRIEALNRYKTPKFKTAKQLELWQSLLHNTPSHTEIYGADLIKAAQDFIDRHGYAPDYSETDPDEYALAWEINYIDFHDGEKFASAELQAAFDILKRTPTLRQKEAAEKYAREKALAELDAAPVRPRRRHLDTRKATMEQEKPAAQKPRRIIQHRDYLRLGASLLGGFQTDPTNGFNLDGYNAPDRAPKHSKIKENNFTAAEKQAAVEHTLYWNILDLSTLLKKQTNFGRRKTPPRVPKDPEEQHSRVKLRTLAEAGDIILRLAIQTDDKQELLAAYIAALENPADLGKAVVLQKLLQELQAEYIQNTFIWYCLEFSARYAEIKNLLMHTRLTPENRPLINDALVALAFIKTDAARDLPALYREIGARWWYAPLAYRRNVIRVLRKALRDISPETQKLLQEISQKAEQELTGGYISV
ncbi:MAG: hypothetical protein LBD99_02605 [Candidatus Margulisbacteria bacterium]|jgi:hypothetical protein|nr:hypothetical protein [Candidatus Margulisiibacteriota bacterium]